MTTAADVGDLVWGKDPEELRKINEQTLKTLGVPSADAAVFFQNRGYTLTSQTRLAVALGGVKVRGATDYVAAAARASGEREALFFVESAELLQRLHAAAPVTAVMTDSRALVAARGPRAIVVLPLDYLRSTAETRQVMTGDRRQGQGGTARDARSKCRRRERVSDRLRGEMTKLGWTMRERIPPARCGAESAVLVLRLGAWGLGAVSHCPGCAADGSDLPALELKIDCGASDRARRE